MLKNTNAWLGRVGFVSLFLLGIISPVCADPDIKLSEWIKELSFKGDLRLRHENIDRDTGKVDRQRQRFRLRIAVDAKLPNNLAVKTRVASGTGEQTSTNQSFDTNGSQKGIWIDRAYLTWNPLEGVGFQGGRMKNPFWVPYSADIVWDSDYNPEGTAQQFNRLVGEMELFANFGQFGIDEKSGDTKDQYLFSNQAGAEVKLPMQSRLKAAVAYHDFSNESNSAIATNVTPNTNRRVGGVLLNEFGILEITGALTSWIGPLPIIIDGTYVKNNRADKKTVSGSPTEPKGDKGVQAGITVGKAKEAGKMELAYYYKEVEADAVYDAIADSDFGPSGGTNRKGHIFWMAYALTDFSQLKVKYFDTSVKHPLVTLGQDDTTRLQVDLATKF